MTRKELLFIALHQATEEGVGINLAKFADICIEWGQQHPHWISVEDELPPFDAIENGTWRCSKDVLIFAPFRGIFVGRYECDDMYGKTYWLFNGGSYPTVERGDGYESSNVTHWMPLPQAPKEGGEE